jgi:hypothetical protein
MPSRSEPTAEIVYRVTVPEDERSMIDDTPDEYLVTKSDGCCCLIYGRYGGLWHCNVSARWLVRHLLESWRGKQ